MIVKIHSRGEGGGAGPVDYLLGRDRKRKQAEVLRGDPEEVKELIDACPYARKYTSGLLSFKELDLPAETKDRLMTDFETALLPGLDADQYSCAWIQHQDKGRLELNFLVSNTELLTGKRLQPYYDRADRTRIDAWKTCINAEHNLHDPDDPANRQELILPADLPRDKKKAAGKITDGLLTMIRNGEINKRGDVVEALQKRGYTIARQTPSSISIADPDGGRNMRLKGTIYEQTFRDVRELQRELKATSDQYRAERESRLRRARARYQERVDEKRAKNQTRYRRPPQSDPVVDTRRLDAGGPDHHSDPGRDAQHRLGSGLDHRGQPKDHQRADAQDQGSGTNAQTPRVADVGDQSSGTEEWPVYRPRRRSGNRHDLDSQRPEGHQTGREGGLTDDRARNTLIERLAEFARGIQNTARRVYEVCQRIASDVRRYNEKKRRDRDLLERLNRAIKSFVERHEQRQQQRGYDLE